MTSVSAMYDDNQSPDRAEAAVESDNWLPQFGLRSLLGMVALMAVLFAVAAAFGYRWGIVLGWFVALGAVHVAANAWGARRRRAELFSAAACSDDPQRHSAQVHSSAQVHESAQVHGTPMRGTTPTLAQGDAAAGGESIMRRDNRQGSRAGGVAVVVAMVAGVLAAILLSVLCGDECGASGIALGGASSAVIGGLAAFAATSFFDCATRAWSEAISADSPRGEDNA
jgi:hypothetical protein